MDEEDEAVGEVGADALADGNATLLHHPEVAVAGQGVELQGGTGIVKLVMAEVFLGVISKKNPKQESRKRIDID